MNRRQEMALVDDLRDDYRILGELLEKSEGSGAAAIVRERRILRAELDKLEQGSEQSLVDELAAKRKKSGAGRPAARRKSG